MGSLNYVGFVWVALKTGLAARVSFIRVPARVKGLVGA